MWACRYDYPGGPQRWTEYRGDIRMKRASAVISGVLIAAAVMTTGCGSTRTPQAHAAVPAGKQPALTNAEQLRIDDAQQRLIKRCMARQGFTYTEAERLSADESRTPGYVSADVGWAQRHGYGSRITAKEDRARRHNPNLVYRDSLSPARQKAFDQAMDGGPDAKEVSAEVPGGRTYRKQVGGCTGESEQRLYGDPRTWFRAEKAADSLRSVYVPQVMRDKRFVTALTAWSRCMERAGHPYKDPGAARQAVAQQALQTAPDKAFPDEREVAVADATCARDTGLRDIGKERETYYLDRLRGRYDGALDTSRLIQHTAFTRASGIVGPRV